MKTAWLFYDGGARGNPGVAGAGAVILQGEEIPTLVWCLATYIGMNTNNVAEYTALLSGVIEATKRKITHLTIVGDSQLIQKHLLRRAQVRHPRLKKLYNEVQENIQGMTTVTIDHTKRAHNQAADALANWAMDNQRTVEGEESVQEIDLQSLIDNDRSYQPTHW
jgi:ribonuclease HI